jgi:transcriptional regulator with XRE-family HTH domain
MSDFCQLLKDSRQGLGLTLEDVAQRTYIKLPYLQALEEGAVERLPAPVYTYGYIRQVAKLLGLDGSALVAKFQQLERGALPAGAARRSAPAMADLPGDNPNPYKSAYGGNGRANGGPLEGPASIPTSLTSVVPAAPSVPNGHYMAAEADPIELRQAKMQAQQILKAAEREASEMVRGSQRYADEVLAELEGEIGKTLQIVRNGRQFLQSRRSPGPNGL